MRFSVVITTYNRRPLLERAIRSVLRQSLAAELIVVDDASSDGTCDYVMALRTQLEQAGDSRLIYQRNAINLGHSRCVNLGVSLAQGEWVKFLDDDDYLAPNCLRMMSEAIDQHPNAVLCSCQAVQVDAQERELERTHSTGPGKAFYIPQEDIHYGMLLEVVPFGTPVQVAAKRSAFLDSGGWDSDFDGNCDDIDSWIRIATFGDAVFLNQCLVYRTVWEGSYNQKFAIARRLQTNILMKRKIYPLVNLKYRAYLPKPIDVDRYLRLHWGLVAIHSGHPWTGIRTMLSACLSRTAWSLLMRALVFRQSPWLVNQTRVKATAIEIEDLDLNDEYSSYVSAPLATNPVASYFPGSLLIHTSYLEIPHLESAWERPLISSLSYNHNKPVAPAHSESLAHPSSQLRNLRNHIRLRNLGRAVLSGHLRLVVRLSRIICLEYGQRSLAMLYPATPPVTKIPIASSSQHHANIAISILQRIRRRESDLTQPVQFVILRRYLRLRWAIAAFKQGYWLMGIRVGCPALFSIQAWQLWIRLIRVKQLRVQEQAIRRMFSQVHQLRPTSETERTETQPM